MIGPECVHCDEHDVWLSGYRAELEISSMTAREYGWNEEEESEELRHRLHYEDLRRDKRAASRKVAKQTLSGPKTRDMTERHSHPHFNDQGTLHWHRSWAEALAEASEGGKKVFIEFGREL